MVERAGCFTLGVRESVKDEDDDAEEDEEEEEEEKAPIVDGVARASFIMELRVRGCAGVAWLSSADAAEAEVAVEVGAEEEEDGAPAEWDEPEEAEEDADADADTEKEEIVLSGVRADKPLLCFGGCCC